MPEMPHSVSNKSIELLKDWVHNHPENKIFAVEQGFILLPMKNGEVDLSGETSFLIPYQNLV